MITQTTKFVPAAVTLGAEGLAYAMVLPHLPVVVGDKAPWWSVGVLLAAYSISQFFVLNPIARLARRYGVSMVLTGCLLGTAAGMVLTALSTNYWVLFAGRVVDGLSAGTVVVVTAAHLRRVPGQSWARALGRLAAVRGASILSGILVAAAIGLALSNPVTALQSTAWIGAGLALLAIAAARRLGGPSTVQPHHAPGESGSRKPVMRHISAQAAQAGLLVLAPAIALVLADQTTSFLAPGAAILGMAIGQLLLAPRATAWPGFRPWAVVLLIVSTVVVLSSPLAGIAMFGVIVGTTAPVAQARLLQARVTQGADDLEANAYAGRMAVLGQVIGPSVCYTALGVGAPVAAAGVAGLAAGTLSGEKSSLPKVRTGKRK